MKRVGLVLALAVVACGPPARAPVDAPLPAPKRVVEPQLRSPSLIAAKKLLDELAQTPRAPFDEMVSVEQLRVWAIGGFMPVEAKREALLDAIRAMVRTAPDWTSGGSWLEGRAMELIADDWRQIRVGECVADPMLCAAAEKVAANARQAWLDRARERFELCASAAHEDVDLAEVCAAKADALGAAATDSTYLARRCL